LESITPVRRWPGTIAPKTPKTPPNKDHFTHSNPIPWNPHPNYRKRPYIPPPTSTLHTSTNNKRSQHYKKKYMETNRYVPEELVLVLVLVEAHHKKGAPKWRHTVTFQSSDNSRPKLPQEHPTQKRLANRSPLRNGWRNVHRRRQWPCQLRSEGRQQCWQLHTHSPIRHAAHEPNSPRLSSKKEKPPSNSLLAPLNCSTLRSPKRKVTNNSASNSYKTPTKLPQMQRDDSHNRAEDSQKRRERGFWGTSQSGKGLGMIWRSVRIPHACFGHPPLKRACGGDWPASISGTSVRPSVHPSVGRRLSPHGHQSRFRRGLRCPRGWGIEGSHTWTDTCRACVRAHDFVLWGSDWGLGISSWLYARRQRLVDI